MGSAIEYLSIISDVRCEKLTSLPDVSMVPWLERNLTPFSIESSLHRHIIRKNKFSYWMPRAFVEHDTFLELRRDSHGKSKGSFFTLVNTPGQTNELMWAIR